MINIQVEGIDGSGKTTGLKYLVEQARLKNLTVVETREVGNPHIPVCLKMRELVLDPKNSLSKEAMEFIFMAMVCENDKWLKTVSSDLVISDRGWLSHLAYTEHNVSKEFVERYYQRIVGNEVSMPDAVIYFDVNPEIASQRRSNRGTTDVIELKGLDFQRKVHDSFNKYMTQYEKKFNIYVIDANQELENVKRQLNSVLFLIVEVLAYKL